MVWGDGLGLEDSRGMLRFPKATGMKGAIMFEMVDRCRAGRHHPSESSALSEKVDWIGVGARQWLLAVLVCGRWLVRLGIFHDRY